MTTARQLLTRAARITGDASEGMAAPAAYPMQVGLNALNAMMREFRGVEIGPKLKRNWHPVVGAAARPGDLYAIDIQTPCQPRSGDRFGVIGAHTVTGNGDTIEGAASVTTTASTSWFYREDLGDWLKEQDVGLDDAHLLTTDLDEALAYCVAARWYFENTGEVTQVIATEAQTGRGRVRQVYGYRPIVCADGPLLRGLAERQSYPRRIGGL
jgi:hypothetical protein